MCSPPIRIVTQLTIARIHATPPSSPVSLDSEVLSPPPPVTARPRPTPPTRIRCGIASTIRNAAVKRLRPVTVGSMATEIGYGTAQCDMIRRMRLTLIAVAVGAVLAAQDAAPPLERAALRLHYVQKPIGYERYTIVRDGDALALTSDFDFTDRGGRVQLAATLRTRPDFTPLAFKATGKSYRFVNVDSEVRVEGSDAIVRADGGEARV